MSDERCREYGALLPGLPDDPLPLPRVEDLELATSRVEPPGSLAEVFSAAPADRAAHALGNAYRDVVRALRGELGVPPDLVAFPTSEAEVVDVLAWAADAGAVVVPYGGGTSVVGGVEYRGERPWVSLDLSRMDRVLEVDATSRAARIQAGAAGPVLEEQLRPHGLTLRFFPQSFEHSTLGGWLATRAGGHYATRLTHVDDLVESMRVVTPAGVSESWRLPGSGAGPSPDRLFLGSEGTLGVVVEAWMRVQDRPELKRSASVAFADMERATEAVRAISQSGLDPANCRLLDPGEAALSRASTTGAAVLVLGVESAHGPVDDRLAELLALARDHGGEPAAGPGDADDPAAAGDSAAESWRSAFLEAPYLRDAMARMSAIVETFETACTWDRLPALYEAARAEIGAAVEDVTGRPGLVNCRLTHVYPDGAAPYFTVIAAARRGDELAMWDEIKAAAMELLADQRATVTHHHAVGRDHRPGYDRQRPEPFAAALRAAKGALDPAGVLNPGVLI